MTKTSTLRIDLPHFESIAQCLFSSFHSMPFQNMPMLRSQNLRQQFAILHEDRRPVRDISCYFHIVPSFFFILGRPSVHTSRDRFS